MVRISLKNIGMFEEASIEINGITVLAGENNTGKSTFSRALFSAFNSFSMTHSQIENERIGSIGDAMMPVFRRTTFHSASPISEKKIINTFINQIGKNKNNLTFIENEINNICKYHSDDKYTLDKPMLHEAAIRIREILNISNEEIFRGIIKHRLNDEFFGQVLNIYTQKPGEICLEICEQKLSIKINEDNLIDFNNDSDLSLSTEAVYMDDPFVIDKTVPFGFSKRFSHRDHLQKRLFNNKTKSDIVNEIIVNKKLENIYDKISSVCEGNIIKRAGIGYVYKPKNSNKILASNNLSAGFKTFAIIKSLLMNKAIENKGILILDEPEIHLHPQWQLLFAEIVVLLQREFNLHVLITTHSPYFLNAVEVYSNKYGIENKCNYYLSFKTGDAASVEDVTGNTEKIYKKLAKPLQELENEQYADY